MALSILAGGNAKWCEHFVKEFGCFFVFLIMLDIHLPYNSGIPCLVLYLKEIKTYVYTKICIQMFIGALFTVNKNWKPSQCPKTGKWKNKPWYITAMEYYSAVERNKILRHETTWMNRTCIILSESSQTQKAICFLFHLYDFLEKPKL